VRQIGHKSLRIHATKTAEYVTEVELALPPADGGYWLDLGEVREIADVRINSQPAGVRWKTPYRVDITRFVKPGRNVIKVEVTNLLINRVLGQPDPDYSALEPLRFVPPREKATLQAPLPSGLLGPARVLPYTVVRLPGTTPNK
jgi:hypothetical protein